MADKPKRNDPCPCGSNKKYKKCCELKKIRRGQFTATQIQTASVPSIAKSLQMSSFFHSAIQQAPQNSIQESSSSLKGRLQENAPEKKQIC